MNDLNFAGNARKMQDFLGKEWEYECLGCSISEGKIKVPGGLIPNYEWMNQKFGKGITYLRDICSYAQENVTQKEIDEILETIEKLKDYFENYKGEENGELYQRDSKKDRA